MQLSAYKGHSAKLANSTVMATSTYGVVQTRAVGANVGGANPGPFGRSDDDPNTTRNDAAAIAANIFGPNITLTMSNSAAPRKGGRAHASTGIPLAISGSASVVNVDVATRLTSFSDPIRAILGTGVHEAQKVIIKRQYVTNSAADIVPERAPARTVALAEDVVEVSHFGVRA